MLFEQLVWEPQEGSIGEGEKAGVIYQHQRSEMAAKKGLSQEKNLSWYSTHFIGTKTKLEHWVRGMSVQIENPVDFTL